MNDMTAPVLPATLNKSEMRHQKMRRMLRLRPTPPEGVTFKVADSTEEIEQACQILYDAYTEAGFMIKDGSGSRFTVYHVLPSAYTLVAKKGDDVIATVTLILRSADPLPIEHLFSIDHYLGHDRRVAEVSALTVHADYRRAEGDLVLWLMKYLKDFSRKVLGLTDLVLTCNPKHIAFYNAILLFENISEEVAESYDFVDGAPACGARLNLSTRRENYRVTYDGQPVEKNLHRLMETHNCPSLELPAGKDEVYRGNWFSRDSLDFLLTHYAKGRSRLTASDLSRLYAAYGPDYLSVLAAYDPDFQPGEAVYRIDTNVSGRFTCRKSGKSCRVRVIAASQDRITLSADAPGMLRHDGLLMLEGAPEHPVPVFGPPAAVAHGPYLTVSGAITHLLQPGIEHRRRPMVGRSGKPTFWRPIFRPSAFRNWKTGRKGLSAVAALSPFSSSRS